MKTYILALTNVHFEKNGKVWTSNPIDLYDNTSYKNYSTRRSKYGLNLLSDNTFVGNKVLQDATPFLNDTKFVTEYGEVVFDKNFADNVKNIFTADSIDGEYLIYELTESPDGYLVLSPVNQIELLRFVDTTSTVDLVGYKASFLNNQSSEPIEYTLQVYESDDYGIEDNPLWIPNEISTATEYLFIKNAKRFIKFEIEFFSELPVDFFQNTLDFAILVEVMIAGIPIPNISNNTKDIVKKFPSWTKIYEDSIEDATPSLQIPESLGGKFVNSLVRDDLDNIEALIDYYNLNKSISGADLNQLSWIYSTHNAPSVVVNVHGDFVMLSPASSYSDFISHNINDYVYYYSPVDRTILTLRSFGELKVNGVSYDQTETLLFNIFDEFGARVGLPRLKMESNSHYKSRILDVYKNLPGVDINSFKKTLRRELDLWRAFGSTPNSDIFSATPNVFDMSDIKKMSKYFEENGNPTEKFIRFVELMNVNYPTNWGFVSWDTLYWDYAGRDGAGVSYIPFVYDKPILESTPSFVQAGVGDLSDLKVSVRKSTDFYDNKEILDDLIQDEVFKKKATIKLSGIEKLGDQYISPQIFVDIESSIEYSYQSLNSPTATIKYLVELDLSGNTYYCNFTKNYVNDKSTTGYGVDRIFDVVTGCTRGDLVFRSKSNNEVYVNSNARPPISVIPISLITAMRVAFGEFIYAESRYVVSGHSSSNNSWLDVGEHAHPAQHNSTSYPNSSSSSIQAISTITSNFANTAIFYGSNMISYETKTARTSPITRTIEMSQESTPSFTLNSDDLVQSSKLGMPARINYIVVGCDKRKTPGVYRSRLCHTGVI
jgi:hypothetical protein